MRCIWQIFDEDFQFLQEIIERLLGPLQVTRFWLIFDENTNDVGLILKNAFSKKLEVVEAEINLLTRKCNVIFFEFPLWCLKNNGRKLRFESLKIILV